MTSPDPKWGMKLTVEELARLQRDEHTQRVPEIPSFPTLAEQGSLTAEDIACMREIRQVLERFGKLERFGISLLHEHFALGPGEILLESTDTTTRRMSLEPAIADPSDVTTMSTQWYLGQSMPLSLVKCRTSMHQ